MCLTSPGHVGVEGEVIAARQVETLGLTVLGVLSGHIVQLRVGGVLV